MLHVVAAVAAAAPAHDDGADDLMLVCVYLVIDGVMLADVKWRFMWRVGPRPAETKYAELNADPVIPRVRTAGADSS